LYPRHRIFGLLVALCVAGAAPAAELSELAALARSILGADQGVYVEAADGSVLVAQAADRAVHPASVSKVPTTLALLRRFGPDHRFITTFSASGRINDGVLDGDLLVGSDGDPYFVDENALLVALRLNELGVHRVTGVLRSDSALTFDWQSDNDATRLRRAMCGMAPRDAWQAVRLLGIAPASATAQMPPSTPLLEFAGTAPVATAPAAGSAAASPSGMRPLVIHRSQPLLALCKSLNDYSNNIFKPLADVAGGAAAVEHLARSVVPETMRSEIILGDGAGTDARNRLSPRVTVKLLRALDQELISTGHALVDILPVAGVDAGTLHDRLNAPAELGRVVGKTGTFGDFGASALIGAIPTSDSGTVYFAILDHGVPVAEARRRQNLFVHELLARLHSVPWNYQPDARPAVARAQAVSAVAAVR
jgi:D-alanyl-D-alanine carboxypeptidase/D-alanyl-D-alanine-endopeptidase (penicillin-binding protein 4)